MPDHPVRDDISLLDRFFYLDPWSKYAWMRDEAPAYWDPSADGGLWGVTRYEDIMTIAKTPELFCSGKSSRPERDSWIPSMINLDEPLHKRRRNIVNRGFTPRRVAEQEPKLRALTTELIDGVIEQGECDFVRDIARWIPMVAIGDMLGVEPEDRGQLLEWSDWMLGGGEIADVMDDAERREKQRSYTQGYFAYQAKVIADRKQNPRDDLVSLLVTGDVDGERLDDEELLQESLLILIGGDETTRHVMTGGLELLIKHPDQKRKLIEDPSKIAVAVEEMLRLVSPILNMNRTLTRDTTLHGEKLREGDRVLLLYQAGNRDDRIFADPDRFDVERWPNRHVAFGGYGVHHCLGAALARLELKILFEEVLARMPDVEISTDAPLKRRPNNFITGIEEMPIRFTPGRKRGQAPGRHGASLQK
ncbi:MAG: cytochrome P450 [Spirochaetaceae bacterium]|nr:cytochrome P450 [Myxococcales bacterium]MCB9725688.1 cytochrome P450 [Spirochaetaceae bacterium]